MCKYATFLIKLFLLKDTISNLEWRGVSAFTNNLSQSSKTLISKLIFLSILFFA